jgi:hypothetical protein
MSGKQQEFNWPRARQLSTLRDCRIPNGHSADGKVVSSKILKAVLIAIDQFAGQERECFAAIRTISENTGYSPRHTNRAIACLEAFSLITKEQRKNVFGLVTNHYRIVWSELALLVPRDEGDRCALGADRCALSSKPLCPGDTQSAIKRKETWTRCFLVSWKTLPV